MGYDTPDCYYQPEKFDLTLIGEIEYSSGSYEFDTRVIWQHKDGALYTARDSGCSCPSPFERYTSLAYLERVDFDMLRREAKQEKQHNRAVGDIPAWLRKLDELDSKLRQLAKAYIKRKAAHDT